MDSLTRLLAIEEIRQVKARYFRLMDQKDFDAMGDVFADDVVCDFSGAMVDPSAPPLPADTPGETPIHGRDAVMAFVRAGLAAGRSIHHGHMPEIEIESEDRASAIFAMYDGLRFTSGALRELHGYGHYYETYRKIDGKWRIATLKLKRLQVDTVQA